MESKRNRVQVQLIRTRKEARNATYKFLMDENIQDSRYELSCCHVQKTMNILKHTNSCRSLRSRVVLIPHFQFSLQRNETTLEL